jgi:preprotein translocase subunit SecF
MAQESFATRLYRGEVSWDFIGRRRIWYALSGLVMLIGIVSLIIRGLNPSIDFKGGAQFQGPLKGHSISQLKDVVSAAGANPEVANTTGSGSAERFNIQTKTLTPAVTQQIINALDQKLDLPANNNTLDITTVGSTWGGQITHKAVEGLIIFLIAVIAYLSIRFEWKMALAAIIALLHDLVITAGIYSLSGLEVSPSTVIALLTILGYSLYDTVVVFDKVRENTEGIAGGSKLTFSQATNLAVNQTLVRSINTSIIALLPVIGLLIIGAGLLGAGSLDDLSVALLIGLASGAYSSIFIASPLLCDFKEREPTYQQLAKRVNNRQVKDAREAAIAAGTVGTTTGAPLATGGGRTVPVRSAPDVSTPSDPASTPDEVPVRTPGVPSRPASRPAGTQRRSSGRGSRPGGRGSKSRKRR